jgi:hypothetical protein
MEHTNLILVGLAARSDADQQWLVQYGRGDVAHLPFHPLEKFFRIDQKGERPVYGVSWSPQQQDHVAI